MSATGVSVEQLFVEYLNELVDEELFDIEELSRKHPEHAAELSGLFDEWKRLRSQFGGTSEEQSIHATLDRRYGVSADPTISLPELGDGDAQSADELLETLAERASSKSRYRLIGEVARGGMGVILKVWDGDLRRHLAMKVILNRSNEKPKKDAPPASARLVSRFLEEAQITGQLDHPAIVPVHELGLSGDGSVYFTMRLVRGRELTEIFKLSWAEKEGWSQTRALGILQRACEAVAFAHAKGVVHRDLKPANVMVGRFGEVYVMDWGLARVNGSPDRHDIRLDVDAEKFSCVITDRSETPVDTSPLKTMDGDIIGTPTFMAPEQALGNLAQVGPHSDVYSLGSMLYHLLAQTPPHVLPGEKTTQHEVLNRLMVGPPKSLAKLARSAPPELISICEKAMARDSKQRYDSVEDLSEDLRAFMENRVVKAYRTGPIVELRKWVRRNRGLAASLAAIVVMAVCGSIAVAWMQSKANDKIATALAETERVNADFVRVTGGLALTERRLAELEDQREQRSQELLMLRDQTAKYQSELDSVQRERQMLSETIQDLQQQSLAKSTDLAKMQQDVMEASMARDSLTEIINKLKVQLDDVQGALVQADSKAAELAAKNKAADGGDN